MPVKLSKEVHAKLKKISKELDMPMAQIVNMFCNQWLKDNK